ncbi:hypothetical protein D3C80_1574240 [compost metagenome]
MAANLARTLQLALPAGLPDWPAAAQGAPRPGRPWTGLTATNGRYPINRTDHSRAKSASAQSRPKCHKKNYILCFCGGLEILTMVMKKNRNNDERYNASHPSKHAALPKLPQVNPQLYPQGGGLAIPPIPHYLGSQRRETYYMWGLPL